MSEAIIIAIITGGFSLIGSYAAARVNNNKIRALLEYRMNIIEEKQDKYNGVIARQYELEKEMGVLENRESVSEHRIADLERKEK